MDYTLSYLLCSCSPSDFRFGPAIKSTVHLKKKTSAERPRSGMTGYDAARRVLDANGLQAVRIEQIPGELTDQHFDPRDNVIPPVCLCLRGSLYCRSRRGGS